MNITKAHRLLLIFSSLIGLAAGGALLFAPVSFFATSGVVLDESSSLLNELRAPGGALFAMGGFVMLGAFVPRWTLAATVVTALLSWSYGLSRILSMVVDGMPAPILVGVCALELTLGFLCLGVLINHRSSASLAEAGAR